jgi:hypothetical protein
MGNPEICTHGCALFIQIVAHGCACRGDKGMHGMHACLLHNSAWVRGYVVDRCAVMCACVRDRGAWSHPCRVDRCTCMCACGMDRHTCVRTCGLNIRALGARLMGAKFIFFGDFNVFYGQCG